MKRALHYAIRPGLYGPRIIAVTLERGGRWWGRDTRDDLGTHGRDSDIRGRFATVEEALSMRDRVQRLHDHFRRQREELSSVSTRLHHAERQCVEQLIDGSPKREADVLTVVVTLEIATVQEFLR